MVKAWSARGHGDSIRNGHSERVRGRLVFYRLKSGFHNHSRHRHVVCISSWPSFNRQWRGCSHSLPAGYHHNWGVPFCVVPGSTHKTPVDEYDSFEILRKAHTRGGVPAKICNPAREIYLADAAMLCSRCRRPVYLLSLRPFFT